MPISEVNILADYGLTLDHFYGLVKKYMGQLGSNSYLQIQATAVPFNISEQYKYFSKANIAQFGDMTIDPVPVSDLLLTNPLALLSREYFLFLSQLLALVEVKELDAETQALISKYQTAADNLEEHAGNLYDRRLASWQKYADATMTPRGDLVKFQHWCDGQPISMEITESLQEAARYEALVIGLRTRKYADPTHQAVVDAFTKFKSPASRTRYPRWDDRDYLEEQQKFSPFYFASLADNDSGPFANRQITTFRDPIDIIVKSTLGGFTDTVLKRSESLSQIKTDWSVSGSGGWGPFSFKANAKSHQEILDDFAHTQSITVATKSLQALPFDMSAWFDPNLFHHPLVSANRRLFERYLGEKGTLLYIPTHLVVARGFRLEFHSNQNWKHDYKSDFSSGGSAAATIFGIGWGGGGNYSKSVHEQNVEVRGHDLVLDDGENMRVLGYNVVKNTAFMENIYELVRENVDKALA